MLSSPVSAFSDMPIAYFLIPSVLLSREAHVVGRPDLEHREEVRVNELDERTEDTEEG